MDALTMTFTVCAAIGGALFVVRLILQFTGAFGDSTDDFSGAHHDGTHSDLSFKILSFQGITAFLLMFGLAGRALELDSHVGPGIAVGGATLAGFASVWVIGKIFSMARGLQSSGTRTLQDAVGAQGTVYLNIPANGTGQARLTVRNHQAIYDVRSEDQSAIATGTPVKVVAVSGSALIVNRV